MNWGTVTRSADVVAIVGSGPSLRGVQLSFPKSVTVIAVNAAIGYLRRTDIWFTADARAANRAIMAVPVPGVEFFAAVPEDYGQPDARHRDLRAPPESHVTFLHRLDGDGPLRSRPGLSEDPTVIHGGNSGYGALGLAYHMGAKRIGLFGIDGGREYHHGQGQTLQDLDVLGALFATAKVQLDVRGTVVIVGSKTSVVDCWPRFTPRELESWLPLAATARNIERRQQ